MVIHDQFEVFDSIVDAVLPAGKGAVVALSHVYFDESGTHEGSRVMGMAGYWFDADQARKFTRDWAKDLERIGISAAHMTDCALGYGEYKNLSLKQRIDSEKLLITHIKRRSKFSIAVCVGKQKYEEIFADLRGAPSAYTFLLLLCVNKIREEIERRNYSGKVAYFFESGHANANEANKFMDAIPKHSNMAIDPYRYASHSFVDKKISLPLQAADMLVWQVRHFFERALDGHEEARKDYQALMRPQDLMTVVEPTHLYALAQLYRNAGEIFGDSLTDPSKPMPGVEVADKILQSFGLSRDYSAQVAAQLARSKR